MLPHSCLGGLRAPAGLIWGLCAPYWLNCMFREVGNLINEIMSSTDPTVPVEKPPVFVTINGEAKVDANKLLEYRVGDVVITGLNKLAESRFENFTFSVTK